MSEKLRAKGLYTIVISGYEPIEAAWSIEEARRELTSRLKEGLKECKLSYKNGYLHRDTPNTGRITLGPSRDSTLWCAITIIPLNFYRETRKHDDAKLPR